MKKNIINFRKVINSLPIINDWFDKDFLELQ